MVFQVHSYLEATNREKEREEQRKDKKEDLKKYKNSIQ